MEEANSIPKLTHLFFNSQIKDNTHYLSITFEYLNETEKPFKLKAIIPKVVDHAVAGFKVSKNGVPQLKSSLKEKQQAHQEFDKAIKEGKDAYKIETTFGHEDILMVEVGNVEPGATVELEISLFGELQQWTENNLLCTKVEIPQGLFPRYGANMIEDQLVLGHQAGQEAKNPTATQDICINVEAEFWTRICVIEGKDNFSAEMLNEDRNSVLINKFSSSTSTDIAIIFKTEQSPNYLRKQLHIQDQTFDNENLANVAAAEQDHESILELKLKMPSDPNRVETNNKEFIFVIDRSGSMSGTQMELAKKALILALRSLPVGCFFNIISFGTDYSTLSPQMIEYNQENLNDTLNQVNTFTANFGGTRLFEPIKWIMEFPLRDESTNRYVQVLTDGGIDNVNGVVDIVKSSPNLNHITLSTIGIGSGASTELIFKLANAGNGMYDMIQNEKLISSIVIKQLKLHRFKRFVDLSLRINQHNEEDLPTIIVLDSSKKAQFEGDYASFYSQMDEMVFDRIQSSGIKDSQVYAGSEPIINLNLSSTDITTSQIHHKIFYNFKVSESSIEKSLKYKILNKHTTFIAIGQKVDGMSDEEVVEQKVKQVSCRKMRTSSPGLVRDRLMSCSSDDCEEDDAQDCLEEQNECLPRDMSIEREKLENFTCDQDIRELELMEECSDENAPSIFNLQGFLSSNKGVNHEIERMEDFDSGICQEISEEKFMKRKASPVQKLIKMQNQSIPVKKTDEFEDILDSQNFDGSFDQEKSRKILEKYLNDVINMTDNQVVAAMLILIQKKFANRSEEWVLIQDKGIQYLNSKGFDYLKQSNEITMNIN